MIVLTDEVRDALAARQPVVALETTLVAHGFPPGEGTFSATPLGWTHAQFVRLAWSIDAGRLVERPRIVACRYTGTCH